MKVSRQKAKRGLDKAVRQIRRNPLVTLRLATPAKKVEIRIA